MTSLFVVTHLSVGVKLLMSVVQLVAVIVAFHLASAINRQRQLQNTDN